MYLCFTLIPRSDAFSTGMTHLENIRRHWNILTSS